MRMTKMLGVVAAPLLMIALGQPVLGDTPAAATTTCQDGTTSTATGKGACSSHGGVQKAAKPAAAAPAAPATAMTSAAATPAAAAPAGATAKCKDGTYSKSKSHSGACSKHGGVSDWLDAK